MRSKTTPSRCDCRRTVRVDRVAHRRRVMSLSPRDQFPPDSAPAGWSAISLLRRREDSSSTYLD
jgi:hypothetical protein